MKLVLQTVISWLSVFLIGSSQSQMSLACIISPSLRLMMLISLIGLFLWVGYFIGECIHAKLPQEILYSLLGGLITGLVIGGTIGLKMHNRIIGIYEGIILQLENPEAGDYTKL